MTKKARFFLYGAICGALAFYLFQQVVLLHAMVDFLQSMGRQ